MNRIGITAIALMFLTCVIGLTLRPQPATAQGAASQNTGWLEGTVLSADNKIVNNPYKLSGPTIRGVRQGGGEFSVVTETKMGGLFVAKNIKPGIYEVSVTNGYVGSVYKMRPQRIHGILVKPGVRTVLNVIMEPGETLDEIGKPVVSTQSAIVVADELARLRKEIEDLKRTQVQADATGR